MFDIIPEMYLGKPTWHLPINIIAQNVGNGKVVGVFQTTQGNDLLYNQTNGHQLVLADAFIRPQLVFTSKHMLGWGMNTILTNGFAQYDKWLEEGELLFDRRK